MDDKANDKLARPPKIEDVIDVCRSLNEKGVKYILIGGVAVILNGYLRATKDIDFLVDASADNIRKIKSALSYLPEKAILEISDNDVRDNVVVRVADEFVIDLMAKACGIDYEQAKNEIEYYEIEGLQIPVASRSLLIKLKNTVRPSDKADVDFLQASLAADKK